MNKNLYLLNRLTAVILMLLCAGCAAEKGEMSFAVKEAGNISGVYFCPKDDCGSKIASFIQETEEYIYCAFFDLDLSEVKSSLESLAEDFDVRLIVDSDNLEYVEDMDIPFMGDGRSSYMHNKFCVSDDSRIITGSMNPTENGDEKNNNNLITVESAYVAENYKDEFLEMWRGEFSKGKSTRKPIVYLRNMKIKNYFCPEDSCSMRIAEEIDKAEESIYLMLFSFTHNNIANSIVMKMQENVSVKGIFEKRGAGTEYSKYQLLDYQGADVRKDNNSATMHHKVIIIDKETVITGSFNPSKNADERNDENILVIYDEGIAEKYMQEFRNVWENYTSA